MLTKRIFRRKSGQTTKKENLEGGLLVMAQLWFLRWFIVNSNQNQPQMSRFTPAKIRLFLHQSVLMVQITFILVVIHLS